MTTLAIVLLGIGALMIWGAMIGVSAFDIAKGIVGGTA